MNHELKIHPQYFCRVADGTKTFEVRKNDRGFQPGDTVTLMEWDPTVVQYPNTGHGNLFDEAYAKGCTGRFLGPFRIGYLLPIDGDRVVFSLLPVGKP